MELLDSANAVTLFSFLNPEQDFPQVRRVCKSFTKLIPVISKHEWTFDRKTGLGPDDDTYRCWEVLLDPTPQKIVQIEIEFDWKDQGYGNRKSCLSLRLLRQSAFSERELIADDVFAPLAPHEAEHFSITLNSSSVVVLSEPGDSLELWRFVGDGGAHRLHVWNFKCRILTAHYSPLASWNAYRVALEAAHPKSETVRTLGACIDTGGYLPPKEFDLYMKLRPYPLLNNQVLTLEFSGNWGFVPRDMPVRPRFHLRLRRNEDYISSCVLIESREEIEPRETFSIGLKKYDKSEGGEILNKASKGDFLEIWKYIGPTDYFLVDNVVADLGFGEHVNKE